MFEHPRRLLVTVGVTTLFLTLSARLATGQCELAQITAADTDAGDRFGWAVALHKDLLVVGAKRDGPTNFPHAGALYLYRRVGTDWILEAELFAEDPSEGAELGTSVAVHGNVVVAGAPGSAGYWAGWVYVFRRFHGTWRQEAKLFGSDTVGRNGFGHAVAFDGKHVVAGSKSSTSSNPARTHVFERVGTEWVEQARLSVSCRESQVLAIEDKTLLVGRPASGAGSVYVYRETDGTWSYVDALAASGAPSGSYFGHAVALAGDRVIVGAPLEDTEGHDAGAAYIFRREGESWIEEARLIASDAGAEDRFGYAVAIDGEVALLGAPGDRYGPPDPGAAYEFERSGTSWTEAARLSQPPGAGHHDYGMSVSVASGLGVVGATEIGYPLVPGAAYVYGVSGDCNQNGILDPCETATGASPDCTFNTVPDECEPDCNNNGQADSCDIQEETSADCDENGVPDECQTDSDADDDGTEDCVDGCPNDPQKVDPGQCDCGYPDDDQDGDGTSDCLDRCRLDPGKVEPGVCGCGTPDLDEDADGYVDCAAYVEMVPISANGPFEIINDSEIVIPWGGQTVTLEIYVSNWGADQPLRTWQIKLDFNSFVSGVAGTAFPLGWDRAMFPTWCEDDTDCPPEWPHCYQFAGPICTGPNHEPEIGAFIHDARPDYVFYGIPSLPVVDLIDYRFGDTVLAPDAYPTYVPPPKYAGTLILDISNDAAGTFTMGVSTNRLDTYLIEPGFERIEPLQLVPTRITIQPPTCGNGECELGENEESCPEDCVEPPVCGNDVCEPGEDEESCPADCGEPPIDGIPTLSTWGMLILTILLLVGGKVYQSQRRPIRGHA